MSLVQIRAVSRWMSRYSSAASFIVPSLQPPMLVSFPSSKNNAPTCNSRRSFPGISNNWSRISTNSVSQQVRSFTTNKDTSTNNNNNNNNNTNNQLYQDLDESSLIVNQFKDRMVHQLWSERAKAKKDPKSIKKHKSTTQQQQAGKTPSESEIRVVYPFTSNEQMAESYKSPWNTMRIGRIFEDLDALAGNIAFYHVHQEQEDDTNNSSSDTDETIIHPLIVTASVDRIQLRKPSPLMPSDQILSGRVTYVGSSSMEIRMHCTGANEQDPWLEAFFTFVTLDPTTKKPMNITPLLPQTPQEQADFEVGAQRAALKKQRRKQQHQLLAKNYVANETIQQHAHELMQQARPLLLNMPTMAARDSIQMASTKMQNALIAQPQVRNLHNRIFGGFLMRRAFELAFANAYVFGGARPVFQEVDEVSFAAPVDVGDLLVFNSRVLYTSSNHHCHNTNKNDNVVDKTDHTTTPSQHYNNKLVHLEVEAWVTVPEQADAKLSNQFYFTFAIVGNNDKSVHEQEQQPLRKILPANIDEAMRMAQRMEADRVQANY